MKSSNKDAGEFLTTFANIVRFVMAILDVLACPYFTRNVLYFFLGQRQGFVKVPKAASLGKVCHGLTVPLEDPACSQKSLNAHRATSVNSARANTNLSTLNTSKDDYFIIFSLI